MMNPETFYKSIQFRGIGLMAGVPDSLLKHLCAYVDANCCTSEHIITANEGNAIALAAGYHLATGKIGAVYMQNSGLGNCVNPLTSLADSEVYSIPMLLIIGWRGAPGIKDEPQHVKQGRITTGQLDLLEISYQILQADSDLDHILDKSFAELAEENAPVALLIRKGTFESWKGRGKSEQTYTMKREQALAVLLNLAKPDDLFISTTGKTSRELFELRVHRGEPQRDFLTVGSMGHTSSIALGVALGKPDRRVICLDGDGSFIMHMGAMPIIASLKPNNLVHVILNNQAHESVGGQSTVAGQIDLRAIALASGYKAYHQASDTVSLNKAWQSIDNSDGPQLLELHLCTGSREDLGRPTSTPQENKQAFMEAAKR